MSGPERSDLVTIGRVIGVFGLRGDVKVAASVFELLPGAAVTAVAADGTARTLRVAQLKPAKDHLRVHFDGIEDANAATGLRGAALQIAAADAPPLPPNAYRESELVGMQVVDSRLGPLGAVVGIAHYPGNDMLVVGEKRTLVPMLGAYGMRVDRKNRTIQTRLPVGFEDLL